MNKRKWLSYESTSCVWVNESKAWCRNTHIISYRVKLNKLKTPKGHICWGVHSLERLVLFLFYCTFGNKSNVNGVGIRCSLKGIFLYTGTTCLCTDLFSHWLSVKTFLNISTLFFFPPFKNCKKIEFLKWNEIRLMSVSTTYSLQSILSIYWDFI